MKSRTSTATEPPTVTAPICWQREAPSACLRIELLNGEIHLFPYTHLVTAQLARTVDDTETLHLTFSTHEVHIEGHNLRDLIHGIQDFAIKWLRTVPEKYGAVAPIREGVITSIRVVSAEG